MISLTIQPTDDIQNYLDILNQNGGGTLNLNPVDTFVATSNLTYYDNVTINGNGGTIDFGGTYQLLAEGTDAYSTGTLAVNYNSTTITGTGTVWTADMVGQSILIGDYWYEIATRVSNTSITLTTPYIGLNITGASYVIATTIYNIGLENITLQNASGTLFKFRYVDTLNMDRLTIVDAGQAIDGDDSAYLNWKNSDADSCTVGITLDNVPFIVFNNNAVTSISGGAGISLNKCNNSAVGILSIQDVTGVGIKFANTSNLGLVNYSIINCSSHGVELTAGNSDIDLISGYINTCGGDGIKLTATTDNISINTNSLLNNTGYGINIANANCDDNMILGNSFTNNTAGSANNSGTSTLIRSNIGLADN